MHIRLDRLRCIPCRNDHGFIRCHVEIQVLLVETPRATEVRADRRPSPFTGVTADFALAITVIIARPFVYTIADCGMGWMTAPAALPFVGVQPRAATGMFSPMRGRHVRGSAWSATQKRCSPVSRAMLMMGADQGQRGGGLGAYGHVDVAGRTVAMGVLVFPACRCSSSASNAVPVITSAGAVSFRFVCTRWRSVCSCLRDIPNSRAKRAVGSPLAMPRSRRTSVAGLLRGEAVLR